MVMIAPEWNSSTPWIVVGVPTLIFLPVIATPGVVTGKPLASGGSLGRHEATARGCFFHIQSAQAQAKAWKLDLGRKRVAVQGFGNAGAILARFLSDAGFPVVAVSDTKGGIYNPKGLDIAKVEAHKRKTGSVKGFPGTEAITNEEVLVLDCDILVPAALENQLTGKNAGQVKARIVCEAANGPTTPAADQILEDKGVMVIPDVLANSGGVTVSYFEWVQGLQFLFWEKEEVDQRLKKLMDRAFADVSEQALKAKVGMRLAREFSEKWPKPVLMELGGKNPAVVTESADLDMAAEGVMKSAFGLQGQKCSACSRVYVDKKVADAFTKLLVEKTKAIKIGEPSQKDVYFGPVINRKAVETFLGAVESAKKGGEILIGGTKLTEGALAKGHFVAPTIARLPLNHELFQRELFVPFLSLGIVSGLDEAIAESNKAEYGLTAGIFSAKRAEIDKFFDEVESGVCYANRRTGATTGAWPGVQSFCGWKGSGSTGKGGCGPYYVAQFMREQSRTVME